jgi:hypothetical protein
MWRFGSARTALSGPNGPPTKTQAGDLGWRKRPVRSTIRIARQLLVVFLDESLEPVHDQNRVVRRACEYEQNGRTLCGLAILAMLGRHGQDARATRLSVAWPSWPCWADTGKMPVPPDSAWHGHPGHVGPTWARCPCHQTLCGLAILAMLARHGQDARATRFHGLVSGQLLSFPA